MKLDPESVIVCEGYHDRAFLRGLLVLRGCEELKNKPYRDGKRVTGKGQYAFRTPRGGWLRVAPAGTDSKLLGDSETILQARMTSPLSHLVVVRDDDRPASTSDTADAAAPPAPDAVRASLEAWAAKLGARRVAGADEFDLDGGLRPTRLSFVIWRAPDAASSHLPAKQTLERLVCAAIVDAYGPRGTAVEAWLASRPGPPSGEKLHKSHAASHMAGWFSDRGYEGLFDAVWEDVAIREKLLHRLAVIGASRVIDALLND
jgi:hypothetical protein